MNVSLVIRLLDQVTGPIRRVQQSVSSAARAMEPFRAKADAAFQSADHIRQAGAGVSEFGAKIRANAAALVDTFLPFEEQMQRVRALTGANGDEFKALTEQARSLGASGRFNATEVAHGMEALRVQGFSVKEIMATLPQVMDAAVVSNTGLNEVIDATTGIMDAFGLGASEMKSTLDTVTAAAQAGGTPIGAMNAALAGAGAAAVEAGLGIERVATLAGLLATRNIEGGQAAATLEKTLKTLAKPSSDAAKFFSALGLKTTETANGVTKLRDPLTVLTELQQKMTAHGISASDQLKNMTLLFERATPDIQAMLRAAREGGLEQLTEAMSKSKDKTSELAATMKKTGAESVRDLGGAVNELKTALGDVLAPSLDASTRRIENIIRSVTVWTQAHPGITKALAVTALAVSGVATAIGGLISVIGAGVAVKGLLNLAFGAGKVAVGLGAILAPALAVGAAIAAITLAVVQLTKAWDTLDFGEAWKGVKDALGDGSFFKTLTLNPFSGLGEDTAPRLGPAQPTQTATVAQVQQKLATAEPPKGSIEVKIDSEGRPRVSNVKARGVDLEVQSDAGMMMSLP